MWNILPRNSPKAGQRKCSSCDSPGEAPECNSAPLNHQPNRRFGSRMPILSSYRPRIASSCNLSSYARESKQGATSQAGQGARSMGAEPAQPDLNATLPASGGFEQLGRYSATGSICGAARTGSLVIPAIRSG